jgi:hypothetical protein
MLTSYGDAEITYYEELGLVPTASPEEIHDAFRLYARLLHPDQQTDPQLKEIGELQMRKLNRIYAILSNPERRRIYDVSLEERPQAPVVFNVPEPLWTRLRPKLAWAGAIALSATLLVWLAAESQPEAIVRATESSNQPASAPTPKVQPGTEERGANSRLSSAEIGRLRTELQTALAQRDAAVHELAMLRGISVPPSLSGGPSDFVSLTEPPQTPVHAAPPPVAPAQPERLPNKQIAGFWFYAKPATGQSSRNQALYPPEYIEATITDDGGVLRGKLRGRFEIVDRAINPDVNFTFTGTQSGMQASGPWTGSGGAKGEVNLRLTSENSLKIDWTSSELGSQLGLSSGTATLTRRID